MQVEFLKQSVSFAREGLRDSLCSASLAAHLSERIHTIHAQRTAKFSAAQLQALMPGICRVSLCLRRGQAPQIRRGSVSSRTIHAQSQDSFRTGQVHDTARESGTSLETVLSSAAHVCGLLLAGTTKITGAP